jgi:hypothetical protein
MKKAPSKVSRSKNKDISLSTFYQKLFIVTVIASWLIEALVILHDFVHSYANAATWTFQVSTWLYAILFFVLGLAYALPRYTDWLRRTFVGTLLAVIGMGAYNAVNSAESFWYTNYYTKHHPVTGSSYWSSFGNAWTVMIIGLALYLGLLWWIRGKEVE